jgi:hypothetical protein
MADGDSESIDGIEDVVDELLGLPPERFTEARNAAAKALRDEGRRDAADTVKGLPRPAVSLWALNGLAHEQPALIEAFLEAAEQLRDAYSSGGDIRAATPPLREAEARVAAAAAELARAGEEPQRDRLARPRHDAERTGVRRRGRRGAPPRAPHSRARGAVARRAARLAAAATAGRNRHCEREARAAGG